MHDINIVFVNYLCKGDILNAAESVFKDIRGAPYSARVTVVDNSLNQDGIKEALAEKFPSAVYIPAEKNLGFGQGNVLGFKSALARYYFALNPDTLIPENSNAVEKLVRFMDANPKIGCVGPNLVGPDGKLQEACYRFDLRSLFIKPLRQIGWDEKFAWARRHADRLLMRDFDRTETRPVDWVQGAAMVVRHDAAEQVGWFDERYFMYLEDCDWCRELWNNGWPVYFVHDVAIMHRHARDSSKVPGLFLAFIKNKLARIHLWSWLKYMWKWRGTHKYFDSED